MTTAGKLRRWYRPLWIGAAALVVCIAVGYAIGTKAAVNALFNTWMIAAGIPATLNVLRYRDARQPGAIPAMVTWTVYFLVMLVLAVFVFGEKCPLMRCQLGTPGVR